jgi:FKBP-type peptidyl-prolyl cis-trans isomerase SlyD
VVYDHLIKGKFQMADTIADGLVVSVAYKLTVDGELIEEAGADDPLDYLHGAENIVPGLEQALTGKKVGDKFTVTLQPADAYGDYDEDDTDTLDREEMPDDIEVGMELLLEDEFGNFFEVTILEITDDEVVIDFNSPLAGKEVTYDIEVLAIREADEEEVEHGHPHGYVDDDEFEDDDE